jgi:O-antigen/teichoic acid export membrane protein
VPTLRTAVVPVLGLSTVIAVTVLVTAPSLAPLVAGDAHVTEVATQLRVLAVFLPLAALHNVVLAATRGFRTMRATVAVESIGRHTLQLLAVTVVQVLGVGAAGVVLAWSAPYAVALAAGAGWLAVLLRRLGTGRSRTTTTPASRSALRAEFWRFTAPRAAANMAQTLLKRSDIVLVAALRSPAEAALYTAATRFVVIGQLGVQALQQALGPQLSAMFARDEKDEASEVYKTATAWSMALSWPIYLCCAVLAPFLLAFFGSGYADAAEVVVILSVAMLVATASGSVDTVLLMSGRSWLSLTNTLSALVVNIVLNLLLIPRLGILGAALAWAVAIVIRNALPLLQIRYLEHMTPLGDGTIRVAASAFACFAVVPGILAVAGASAPWRFAALLVGGLVYLLLLWLARERLHLAAFRNTLVHRGSRQRRDAGRNAEDREDVTSPSG